MTPQILIVIEAGYDSEQICYVGHDWDAMVAYVEGNQWSYELRIEIWNPSSTSPARILRTAKVERYVVPEKPEGPTDG